jgi:hypothetical protein
MGEALTYPAATPHFAVVGIACKDDLDALISSTEPSPATNDTNWSA